ncbi:hypothetical protein NADE_005797 [Nannochloris sp. 'desiccata']|nr:hypothetical protein KSW81_007704 [Chlorella desiccata (nom. nud.)]KAH7618949.1 hypothetical protein NADE_005797 [Chlorella desiccata (nom. nud.)]
MQPATATTTFESQPRVLPTATESQPDLFLWVEEPFQAHPASNGPMGSLDSHLSMFSATFLADLIGVAAGTARPRRGDKTPASFADYTPLSSLSAEADLLNHGVYRQYKDLTLPLQRYLVDMICAEWFGKLRFATKTNYLNAIHRVTEAHHKCRLTHPSGTLSVLQSALTRLVAIQLGVPADQRPVADATKKFKNRTLLTIESKSANGGSAWKLLVEKWRGFARPNRRVAAVQKNAQAKLITVAEIKQVQAVALMSPLRELDAILLSLSGLSFLMSIGKRSEILPHLKFFGMKLTVPQKHDGTTRHLLGFSLDKEKASDGMLAARALRAARLYWHFFQLVVFSPASPPLNHQTRARKERKKLQNFSVQQLKFDVKLA